MSKKRKRQSRRSRAAVSTAGVAKTPRRRSAQDFNPDYSYIKEDLKRVGVLSGSFLVILIALAFFLN